VKSVCLIAIVMLALVAGCSIVMPADRAVIHDHYLNASAINAKVQAEDTLPIYVRTWWDAEEKTWKAMDAWSKGEKFPAATQPAGGN
jgi:hypothetical protein